MITQANEYIKHLTAQNTLSRIEAKQLLSDIAEGYYAEVEMASFLTVFMMRNITVDELSGFRDALLQHALKVDLGNKPVIDLCGTGGDNKNTFNISTLASFVTAGAGARVAKHGNYGVSSSCGSSNILEYFGYTFTNDQRELNYQLDEAGICFLHAPLFNPAMKNIAPVRRGLKAKTFFNMLGPMVNPASPQKQLVGVFSLELARLYGYIYQNAANRFTIVHSVDGYDEVSLTGPFKTIDNNGESYLTPEDLGVSAVLPSQIAGGETIEESADIFVNVLQGKGDSPREKVVLMNAALALQCYFDVEFQEGHALAKESLYSKKAFGAFQKLIDCSGSSRP